MTISDPRPDVEGFHDKDTGTITYVVTDRASRHAVVIDAVLDYDPKSGRTSTRSADAVIAHVRERGASVQWVLDTHVHADHLSGSAYVKRAIGGRSGIGDRIGLVQVAFKNVFGFERDFHSDGRQFDHLFADGESFTIGTTSARALATPGHTPACISYIIGDAVFVGDTLFMPDSGTARADFPGGDAATLYCSIRRILALPPETRVFICHDYQPGGRSPEWETTVAAQRAHNIHVRDGVSEADFVALRTGRDKALSMPTLIIPSVQVNICAGELPPPAENGVQYLRVPLNVL